MSAIDDILYAPIDPPDQPDEDFFWVNGEFLVSSKDIAAGNGTTTRTKSSTVYTVFIEGKEVKVILAP